MILLLKRIVCILVSLVNVWSISNISDDSFWKFGKTIPANSCSRRTYRCASIP